MSNQSEQLSRREQLAAAVIARHYHCQRWQADR